MALSPENIGFRVKAIGWHTSCHRLYPVPYIRCEVSRIQSGARLAGWVTTEPGESRRPPLLLFLHVSDFTNTNGNMDASASKPIAVAWAAQLCVILDSQVSTQPRTLTPAYASTSEIRQTLYPVSSLHPAATMPYIPKKLQSLGISSGRKDRQAILPTSKNQDPTHNMLADFDRHTQKDTVYVWAVSAYYDRDHRHDCRNNGKTSCGIVCLQIVEAGLFRGNCPCCC